LCISVTFPSGRFELRVICTPSKDKNLFDLIKVVSFMNPEGKTKRSREKWSQHVHAVTSKCIYGENSLEVYD